MLSISRMAKGQATYYLRLAQADYYLSGGEPLGVWWGSGAAALKLAGVVQADQLEPLLQGFSPAGEKLIQNAGSENHRTGFDLTFSASKSVSVLWSVADTKTRHEVQEAHFVAVQAALQYLEDHAGFTRRGRGGVHHLKAGFVVATFEHGTARSEDVPHFETEAPPNDALLKHIRGGAFFVSKSLKEEYDRLLSRVQALQADLDTERIRGADALHELQTLQAELNHLREDIERKKVLVSPVKVYRQSETTLFDLGPARLLVITADNIRVEGWNGPQVKCVLEKSVLASDDKPADDHFRSIKLVHHHGAAPNVVGQTPAERDASEQKFSTSPDGQKLNEQQRTERRGFLRQIADRFELYRAFQGKQVDTLDIEGLTYEQGNRSIVVGFRSTGGWNSSSSNWQRDAALTVYVPACEAVALRGCLVNLDVQGVRAALIVTGDGSRDRDYEGHFQVRDLHGSLTVENAPLDLVATIHGSVFIRSTVEYANTEQRHDGTGVTFYMPPPRVLTCRNIDGDLTAWFTRVALKLEAITGRIDVINEFGDTTLSMGRGLAEKAHRVLSESSGIEINLAPQALRRLPLQALTSCGTIRTKGCENLLHGTNFTIGQDPAGRSRDWRGVASGNSERAAIEAELLSARAMRRSPTKRVVDALQGRERSPGLDLISRCGTVRVFCERQNQSSPAR